MGRIIVNLASKASKDTIMSSYIKLQKIGVNGSNPLINQQPKEFGLFLHE